MNEKKKIKFPKPILNFPQLDLSILTAEVQTEEE